MKFVILYFQSPKTKKTFYLELRQVFPSGAGDLVYTIKTRKDEQVYKDCIDDASNLEALQIECSTREQADQYFDMIAYFM